MTRANRSRTIGIAVVVLMCMSSVGLYLLARDLDSESEIKQLIEPAYAAQRPGGGRLFGAPYSPKTTQPQTSHALGQAQLLILRQSDVEVRQRLQGLIYLASGEWASYIDKLGVAKTEDISAVGALNNLGVSFLALSDSNPTYLLRALDHFERAIQLQPTALEPRFNLVVTYRKLRLPANRVLGQYKSLDSRSQWYRELDNAIEVDQLVVLDELRSALQIGNLAEAERVFEKDPDLCRRIAMQYGVSNGEESAAVVRFIAEHIQRRYGDKTVSAMLAPLFTERRETIVAVRNLVLEGAQAHDRGNRDDALRAYASARKVLGNTPSPFDDLWIDLNRVDTEIRIGQFEAARETLRKLVLMARQHGFTWIMAKALSTYGSSMRLTSSYLEMMNHVEEADQAFIRVSSGSDRVRTLYYLSAYRYGAGDHNEALKLALECRRLVEDSEYGRISALNWLIGSILYRQGLRNEAVLFAEESVEQSYKGGNPAFIVTTASALAQLYESMSEKKLSEKFVAVAEDALPKIAPSFDQIRSELLLGVVKATMELNRSRYVEAEALLEKNLDLYSQQPFSATPLLSSSLLLLARTYAKTDRFAKASQKFEEAIEVVEGDAQYLQSERLRVSFDDSRRDLYDSAIEFEYDKGSPEAAWTYLQRYRSKLFLEFLGQFNPEIEEARARIDRSGVQKFVPSDIQIIEYALLKDRLLIWLITDKLFTVRSIRIAREEVENKVQQALQKLRTGSDVGDLLLDLGKLLIGPVEQLLDPRRTIAIIPDRALHGLPFAALRRTGTRQYLIQDFPVTVSPSLTYLLATSANRTRRSVIVGFGSLNGASTEMKELEALRNIYPNATTVAGRGVDKTGFLNAMNTAGVFHYAGHSATDAADPLRSSILLDGNRHGPNSVTAVEISQQRLPKNAVVILSSCDSSVGNSRDGIGVRGLTSAFLIGGAGSVVGSLWPVEASSTAELMIKFHRSFATSQLPVAKALRQAQLQFLEAFPDRSHPYYWSGFVVTGNLSALR